jgi:chemotaxis signal transduction protein
VARGEPIPQQTLSHERRSAARRGRQLEVTADEPRPRRLGTERFAVPMDAVAEVGRLPGCTRVPGTPAGSPASSTGAAGRSASSTCARCSACRPRTGAHGARDAGLVILFAGQVQVGLRTDRVDGVLDVDLDDLEPTLMTMGEDARSLLRGQALDAEGPVGVLDENAVFALRDRVASIRRAG